MPYSNILFIAFKKSIRMICKDPHYVSCKEFFDILGMILLPCIFVFQYLWFVNENLARFCTNAEEIHNYIPTYYNNIMIDSFTYLKRIKRFIYL